MTRKRREEGWARRDIVVELTHKPLQPLWQLEEPGLAWHHVNQGEAGRRGGSEEQKNIRAVRCKNTFSALSGSRLYRWAAVRLLRGSARPTAGHAKQQAPGQTPDTITLQSPEAAPGPPLGRWFWGRQPQNLQETPVGHITAHPETCVRQRAVRAGLPLRAPATLLQRVAAIRHRV
ncbi:hypothetical protein NDU88_005873 [Pleurodeles waltl]|uniref:Uncharacterized protein n=1 Tax=Pleurodeles waltl TaxID=8319 RepID=A0AAV7TBX1_PLEWA|nr:hypothetical protein NDU88_005873 [Pleurodeles waltl]